VPDNDKAKWLAGLEVGDLVVVTSTWPTYTKRFRRIKRFTKTLIVTEDDWQFRRKDGYTPGESWPCFWIGEPTRAQARKAKAGKAGR
jgi:hypothetical protein